MILKHEGSKDVKALEELYIYLSNVYADTLKHIDDHESDLKEKALYRIDDAMDHVKFEINSIKSLHELGDKREYITRALERLAETEEDIFSLSSEEKMKEFYDKLKNKSYKNFIF